MLRFRATSALCQFSRLAFHLLLTGTVSVVVPVTGFFDCSIKYPTNAAAICGRAEALVSGGFLDGKMKNHYDYVVSRSVAVLQDLCAWSKSLIKPGGKLVTLKGGDISGEIRKTRSLPYVKNIHRKVFDERILVTVDFV